MMNYLARLMPGPRVCSLLLSVYDVFFFLHLFLLFFCFSFLVTYLPRSHPHPTPRLLELSLPLKRVKGRYLEVLCLVHRVFPPKNITDIGGFVQPLF